MPGRVGQVDLGAPCPRGSRPSGAAAGGGEDVVQVCLLSCVLGGLEHPREEGIGL